MKRSNLWFCRKFSLFLIIFFACSKDPGEPKLNNIFDPSADFDNTPPLARLSIAPDSGITMETEFIFNASHSMETEMPEAKLYYRWDFNSDRIWDTMEDDNPKISYQFPEGGGNKLVSVLVRGAKNQYADTSITVFVNTRPRVFVDINVDTNNDKLVHFNASNSWDYEDNNNLEYRWDFNNDGSWEIPWNISPQVVNEFSSTDWILKLEVRDSYNLISERIVSSKIPGNPIAYYPFNGNALDESGNGNHGTIYGAVLTTDRFGKPNSAYQFNGVNDYIWLGDGNILRPDHLSLALWFSSTSNKSNDYGNVIVHNRLFGYGIVLNPVYNNSVHLGQIIFDVWASNKNIYRYYSAESDYNNGEWYFVCATYDGYNFKVYIKGQLVFEDNHFGENIIFYEPGGISFGRDGNISSSYYEGKIDDVRIYNRALTADEIISLYHQ